MWIFTKHINERMELRNITNEMILKIVGKAVNVLVYKSPQDETVDLYFGKVDEVFVLVVVNRETKRLITVRNMRVNEKKVYNREFEL